MWGRQYEQTLRGRKVLCLSGMHWTVKKGGQIRKKTEETLTLGIKAVKVSSQQCFGGSWNQSFLQQREHQMRRKQRSGEGWGARTMTSTFCCGKECVSRTWKGKRKLCVLYQVLQVPYIQSPRVLQVTLYKTQKSQGDWVGRRLNKEWEVGGCEKNFNVCVCVRDKSLSTFLHLLRYFSGIADLELGGRSPLLCLEPDGFPAWEAPSGLRAGGGAETWAGILCLCSSSDAWRRRTAQTLYH